MRRLCWCSFAAILLAGCEIATPDANDPIDVSGEWDFDAARPGDEAGICHVLGAMILEQAGNVLTGSVTGYVAPCYLPSGGAITRGTLSGDSVHFTSGGCSHAAGRSAASPDSISGTFRCTGTSGTWTAVRVGEPAALELSPGDRTLVVGAALAYSVVLRDQDGLVLYGRPVSWTSGSPGVATVSADGLVQALAPGVTNLTASAGGLTTSAAVTVSQASFVALAPGAYHTCALAAGGVAYCWGSNASGQLGDGTTRMSSTPVPVSGAFNWASLAAGGDFTCGVTTAGAAWCWGANYQGQLGTGDSIASAVPRAVADRLTFTRVAAGGWHACALTDSGAAWCWGRNDRGQLGSGARSAHSLAPLAVAGGLTFAALGAGQEHTCGVTSTGAAYCWGHNAWGQLGNGSRDSLGVPAPALVAGGLSFTTIGGGRLHSCALATSGTVWCWGEGVYGQLGTGSRTPSLVPAQIAGGRTYNVLSVGSEHNSALAAAGGVWGWGSNATGESGDSTRTEWDVPALVPGGLTFTSVAAGWMHSCGIAGGVAYCWGYNVYGALGDGTHTDRRSPVRVVGQP